MKKNYNLSYTRIQNIKNFTFNNIKQTKINIKHYSLFLLVKKKQI